MDRSPGVMAAATVDQAVFTSLRGPLGEGYRIVGASAGVTADERRLLTRMSPSHDSLCWTDDMAEGVCSYPVAGRWAVAWSRHAGLEHTGRGGFRVYTSIVLLRPEQFQAFGADPFEVIDAVDAAMGGRLDLEPATLLGELTLVPQRRTRAMTVPAELATLVGRFMALRVAGDRLTVERTPARRQDIQDVWSGIPSGWRCGLSLSWGVKPAAARSFNAVLLVGEAAQAPATRRPPGLPPKRSAAPACSWDGAHDVSTAFEPWVGLVRRYWQDGRQSELLRLTRALDLPPEAHRLEPVVALAADLDKLADADSATLGQLIRRHNSAPPACGAHQDLLERFTETARARRAHLEVIESGKE